MPKKSTQEEFINRAINKHGDRFDYSKSVYVNSSEKIEIICKTHGSFWATPNNHLNGSGCFKCKIENQGKLYIKSKKQFITESKNIHGNKYGYEKVVYKGTDILVKIYCKKCKRYWYQSPHSHLNGRGCRYCVGKDKTTETFIKEAKIVHGDIYDYSKTIFNGSRKKLKIYCKKCESYFHQVDNYHLQGNGCPKCRQSKGELKISEILNKYNITYIQEKRFVDCKDKRSLSFDFYLPEHNICIEYQGKQHYIPLIAFYHKKFTIKESTDNLKSQQKRDKIKKEYCKNNNIKLIEIPYWDFNNIKQIITDNI